MKKSGPLSLDPYFGKLGREIDRFANHTNRYVLASYKYRDLLLQASEWTEGTAPLGKAPSSPIAAMRAIDKFARIHRAPRQSLFGSYFAHHHLRQQAEISRTLLRESFSRTAQHRAELCSRIHTRSVRERRAWITALLETTISASAPGLRNEDYAIFNVGALTDHEDVDLAIVVASVEAREQFAAGFASITKTFLRFASKIQFFLAEQLVNPRAGGLIEEYEEIIEDPFSNVVVVMQLLGAQFLCGSPLLAQRFTDRITTRFFAQIGDPLLHEGFLRTAAQELTHFLKKESGSENFAPKQEIYIPSRLIIASLRVIHGIHTPYPPEALDNLVRRNPNQRDVYLTLKRTFVQNEVLRSLVFLYVIKSDEIDLYDPAILAPARRVASLLGLRRSARKSAEERLWSYYTELRTRNNQAGLELTQNIKRHLGRVSTFQKTITHANLEENTPRNFAILFIELLQKFRRGVFWDEVVSSLRNNQELSDKFLNAWNEIEESKKNHLAYEFISMMSFNSTAVFEFLIMLAERRREVGDDTTDLQKELFWHALLQFTQQKDAKLGDFLYNLDSETEMGVLIRTGELFSASQLSALANSIEEVEKGSRGERIVRKLRSVIVLVHHHANRVNRLKNRIEDRTPNYFERLGDPERAKKLAKKLRSQAAHEFSSRKQLKLIGDAFDISIITHSLNAILDGAPATRDERYIKAFDDYIRSTFKICFRETQAKSPLFERIRPGTGFALYATGGYGRNQGFGADFDYFAITSHADAGMRKFFSKVIQKLEATILRRGVIPHNRQSHEFNSYVIELDELKRHLENRTEQTFVDEAEILESRFILGDLALQKKFSDKVVDYVLGPSRECFVLDILNELLERRTALPIPINLKNGYGGLREIQLLRLALGAMAGKANISLGDIIQLPGFLTEEQRASLRFISVGYDELRRTRDLYRLVVAGQENPIDTDSFINIARDLPPLKALGIRPNFGKELEHLMTTCGRKIDQIVESFDKIRVAAP
ncbi:MAG: hypothetical protein VYC39_04460 [Myxococcota bacterium]|nr:hypothetical protein [Myxococcota bacterium]